MRQRMRDLVNGGADGPAATTPATPITPATPTPPTTPASPATPPTPALRHTAGVWSRAAGGVQAMSAHFAPVRAELTAGHEGVAAGTAGLNAPAELGAVQESWVRRFEAARQECGALAGALRAVARAHGETDAAVRSSFRPAAPSTHGVER
ncbi:hypothetical protein MHW47_18455 [Streptomyces sp. OfavH-34-F]|uniref:hypothetical protein n=1 Tax=Streptomyces sp. OfavH-34-F TaxID=2917760 RepID=UPI001EF2F23C|nr:hypothetical protein [Streptomyces sp. OfavH-34-F]MCG7526421.1 hypothetical protein [Streptomyces sp. OfavH-34-F]